METDEGSRHVLPFQLQFDKPLASQMAERNPEKDLLAMVTEDSKVVLHRFNWQRLWTISPGKCIPSLCWRPDGKGVVLGLQDGTVSLHDVEILGTSFTATLMYEICQVTRRVNLLGPCRTSRGTI
ncbi:hypothetical protein BT93_E2503 [Corymbia citriodora subsp. variegata]|nr:hypothetical protein BT93_E2503 [Corymbia citriodora subsp. variegata]